MAIILGSSLKLNKILEGVMHEKTGSKKIRKVILEIHPNPVIKEKLQEEVFRQILDSVSKYKASEFRPGDDQTLHQKSSKKVYYLILSDPNNEKRVRAIIEKFNYEVIL